jgi:hypothetical protein
VFNVQPPLVDSAKLIYQVHDGQASDVSAVRDRGVAITKGADYADAADLNTTAPAAGTYRTLKSSSGSYFRLGSTPAGTVTADVLGDAPAAGGYVDKTGDIVLRLLALTSLTSSDIEPTSFGKLNGDVANRSASGAARRSPAVDEMVDELLAGVGAFGGFTRYGAFQVGQIATASGTEKDTYTESEIMSIEREPLPEPASPRCGAPSSAGRRTTPCRTTSPRGHGGRAHLRRRADPLREERGLLDRHATPARQGAHRGRQLRPRGRRADRGDARGRQLWNGNRAAFRVRVRPRALSRDLGHVVVLKHKRHGLSDGVPGRIIEHGMNGTNVELVVLT